MTETTTRETEMKRYTYRVEGGYIAVKAESQELSWIALMGVYNFDPIYGSIRPELIGIEAA